MSRRLGGVPKARGHIQGGKSYKTGVLQHPIALQRSDCQSHVKRAKGTSLRPDTSICPKKNLDAACDRAQKKGKLSTSRRSTRYRCFGQDLTELAGSWPCRTYPTAKIQPFSFSAKNFFTDLRMIVHTQSKHAFRHVGMLHGASGQFSCQQSL